MKFQNKCEAKDCFVFLLTLCCCWDLINPFGNPFLDLTGFSLALQLLNKCTPSVYSRTLFKVRKTSEVACEASCRWLCFSKDLVHETAS